MQKVFTFIGIATVAFVVVAALFLPFAEVTSIAIAPSSAELQGSDDEEESKRTISVLGSSEISVPPEKVEIFVSIITEAVKAKESQAKNAQMSQAVTTALQNAGITKNNIETVSYSLQDIREWDSITNKYRFKGYQTVNSLKVSSTDISKAGEIIDVAVTAGANQIDSIVFSLPDLRVKELKTDALMKASEETLQKAEAMAQAVGVTVKQLESLSESQAVFYPVYKTYATAGVAAEASPSTEIFAGDIKVSAQVSAVYSIE